MKIVRLVCVMALAGLLAGCADNDWGETLRRTLGNTAASYCHSASNCAVEKRDSINPGGRDLSKPARTYEP